MSGFLVTSTWGHPALIGLWAAAIAVTLLAARPWVGMTPAAAATHLKRRPHRTTQHSYHRPAFDSLQRLRG